LQPFPFSGGNRVRIAQVAPLVESVPPKLYGGTERVVSYLTEELVRAGHDVTLFASGDSVTGAHLVPVCSKALRLNPKSVDHLAHHIVMLEEVFSQSESFDIIHFHIDYLHFPLSRREGVAQVTTLHGRLDLPDLQPIYQKFGDMPVVSVSDAQRDPLATANWQGTVYHGLPQGQYKFYEKPGNYLAFLGRISPEKGVDRAIEIASRAGVPLKIAAKVDRADQEYFETTIQPLLNNPLVDFIGEIGYPDKNEFLGNALALLFPINWPEPFGLVMIEAMACGTPVIAHPYGSVPEIIEEGQTGFLVGDAEQGAKAVKHVSQVSREGCRQRFEERFSATRMAKDYLAVYDRLTRAVPEVLHLDNGVSVG
jgi:glycosyltransferase involved in cell wall biosynthesis